MAKRAAESEETKSEATTSETTETGSTSTTETSASAKPESKTGAKKRRKKKKAGAKAAKVVASSKKKKPDASASEKPAKGKRKKKRKASAAKSTVAATAAPAAASVNKTALVESYLEEHPKAGPTEIASALKAQGVDMSPGYASGIKFNWKLKRRKAKVAARKAAETTAPVASKSKSGDLSLETLLAAKQLAASFGSIEAARAAIAALAKLTN